MKIVLQRAGHTLNSAIQQAGDEEWALLLSAQQIYLVMKTNSGRVRRRKGTSGLLNARVHRWCHLSAWHLEGELRSPFTLLSRDVSATGQGPGPGWERGWAVGEHEHQDNWGTRLVCPRVGPVSLHSHNRLSWRLNIKVKIPEPGRGSGNLTGSKARPQKGQNNSNGLSTWE